MTNQEKYDLRLKRFNDAVALKEPDMVPVVPWVDGLPYVLYPETGASHKSALYEFSKVIDAHVRYHKEFEPDANTAACILMSGKAGEVLRPASIDWPGRPGTPLPDSSIYQILETEYMFSDEYDELVDDFTGFVLHKYLPRTYKGLEGLAGFRIKASAGMSVMPLMPVAEPEVQEALRNLVKFGEEQNKVNEAFFELSGTLGDLGFPPWYTGVEGAPFDILSDYYRGTLGTLFDQAERPEKIKRACDFFADLVISNLGYMNNPALPVKRVFFPLHKGMDKLMSDEQYRELYWQPYQKILRALIEMGVTPLIYTEGPYNTRIQYIREQLMEFPPGSTIIHFEEGDFAEIKKAFQGIACVSGGLPLYLLEYGTKAEVTDHIKYLIDNCAAGGGYLMEAGACIENAPRENMEAVFETARTYGKK